MVRMSYYLSNQFCGLQESLAGIKQDVQAAKSLGASAPATVDSPMGQDPPQQHDKILAIRPAQSRGPQLPAARPQERRPRRLEGQQLATVRAAPRAGLTTEAGLAMLLAGVRAPPLSSHQTT